MDLWDLDLFLAQPVNPLIEIDLSNLELVNRDLHDTPLFSPVSYLFLQEDHLSVLLNVE
jgi:hypothetical protein